jgi:2-octaprenyl-6-methoxyphenol hydroxylase
MIPLDFDIIIVGGGLVGASLAASLRQSGLRIAVIETHPWATTISAVTSYDERVIALNYIAKQILQGIGVWNSGIAQLSEPIQQIHVSEQGGFGFTRLEARKLDLPALGYVISANALLQKLQSVITPDTAPTITLFAPAQLTQLHVHSSHVTATVTAPQMTQQITARLIVAADGGNSPVRHLLGIDCHEYPYEQTAIIANVTLENAHQQVAYERFGSAGTIALLPLPHNLCSLVWSVKTAQQDDYMQLSDNEFLARLQRHFGWRLGRFLRLGRRVAYPLRLVQVTQLTQPRVVFIGNAAHTLHPVAGQGLNLGLRDVATLADLLSNSAPEAIGTADHLRIYADRQRQDHRRVITITDSLVKTFSNDFMPMRWARNLSLLAIDALPPLKKLFVQQMTGLTAYPSRLSSGLNVQPKKSEP